MEQKNTGTTITESCGWTLTENIEKKDLKYKL